MAKHQARWARGTSGDKIHGDYVRNEDASGQALMKSVGSTFGVASRGNKLMQRMLAKEQANEEPTFQDAASFDLSRTLPTAGGFPATRPLSDPGVRRHCREFLAWESVFTVARWGWRPRRRRGRWRRLWRRRRWRWR